MRNSKFKSRFVKGFQGGIGWSFGVTLGFVIVSIILAIFVKVLGGTPYIGKGIANIVEATQDQLQKRTPNINR